MADVKDTLDLFLRHRRALIDYATPIVGDSMRAEDVVQEAWLRFDSASPSPTSAEAGRGAVLQRPVGYLYKIVRNLAVDLSRRLKREAWMGDGGASLDGVAAAAPSPEQAAIDRDDLRAVAQALASLPPRTRTAFDLHRFENRTFAEIGQRLGISQTRAHSLVHEALAHCLDHLDRSSRL
ncbi:RNA polymerase subunit sigma-24 [Rhodospirillum rubrum]|nr:RNA polymerase subunit sigma-24 [Rhodospirillum rubrum]MBK1675862.1 RNA polymerase subunit sigma-24 [Rhodospirillum rubrum]